MGVRIDLETGRCALGGCASVRWVPTRVLFANSTYPNETRSTRNSSARSYPGGVGRSTALARTTWVVWALERPKRSAWLALADPNGLAAAGVRWLMRAVVCIVGERYRCIGVRGGRGGGWEGVGRGGWVVSVQGGWWEGGMGRWTDGGVMDGEGVCEGWGAEKRPGGVTNGEG